MKLFVKVLKTPAGGTVACLIDEQGNLLPGQRDTCLDCKFGSAPTFTVTFVVNGKDVMLMPG